MEILDRCPTLWKREKFAMMKFYAKLVKYQILFVIFFISILIALSMMQIEIIDITSVIGIFFIGGGILGVIAYIVIYFIDVKENIITQRFFFVDFLIEALFIYFAIVSLLNIGEINSAFMIIFAIPGPTIGMKIAYAKHPRIRSYW